MSVLFDSELVKYIFGGIGELCVFYCKKQQKSFVSYDQMRNRGCDCEIRDFDSPIKVDHQTFKNLKKKFKELEKFKEKAQNQQYIFIGTLDFFSFYMKSRKTFCDRLLEELFHNLVEKQTVENEFETKLFQNYKKVKKRTQNQKIKEFYNEKNAFFQKMNIDFSEIIGEIFQKCLKKERRDTFVKTFVNNNLKTLFPNCTPESSLFSFLKKKVSLKFIDDFRNENGLDKLLPYEGKLSSFKSACREMIIKNYDIEIDLMSIRVPFSSFISLFDEFIQLNFGGIESNEKDTFIKIGGDAYTPENTGIKSTSLEATFLRSDLHSQNSKLLFFLNFFQGGDTKENLKKLEKTWKEVSEERKELFTKKPNFKGIFGTFDLMFFWNLFQIKVCCYCFKTKDCFKHNENFHEIFLKKEKEGHKLKIEGEECLVFDFLSCCSLHLTENITFLLLKLLIRNFDDQKAINDVLQRLFKKNVAFISSETSNKSSEDAEDFLLGEQETRNFKFNLSGDECLVLINFQYVSLRNLSSADEEVKKITDGLLKILKFALKDRKQLFEFYNSGQGDSFEKEIKEIRESIKRRFTDIGFYCHILIDHVFPLQHYLFNRFNISLCYLSNEALENNFQRMNYQTSRVSFNQGERNIGKTTDLVLLQKTFVGEEIVMDHLIFFCLLLKKFKYSKDFLKQGKVIFKNRQKTLKEKGIIKEKKIKKPKKREIDPKEEIDEILEENVVRKKNYRESKSKLDVDAMFVRNRTCKKFIKYQKKKIESLTKVDGIKSNFTEEKREIFLENKEIFQENINFSFFLEEYLLSQMNQKYQNLLKENSVVPSFILDDYFNFLNSKCEFENQKLKFSNNTLKDFESSQKKFEILDFIFEISQKKRIVFNFSSKNINIENTSNVVVFPFEINKITSLSVILFSKKEIHVFSTTKSISKQLIIGNCQTKLVNDLKDSKVHIHILLEHLYDSDSSIFCCSIARSLLFSKKIDFSSGDSLRERKRILCELGFDRVFSLSEIPFFIPPNAPLPKFSIIQPPPPPPLQVKPLNPTQNQLKNEKQQSLWFDVFSEVLEFSKKFDKNEKEKKEAQELQKKSFLSILTILSPQNMLLKSKQTPQKSKFLIERKYKTKKVLNFIDNNNNLILNVGIDEIRLSERTLTNLIPPNFIDDKFIDFYFKFLKKTHLFVSKDNETLKGKRVLEKMREVIVRSLEEKKKEREQLIKEKEEKEKKEKKEVIQKKMDIDIDNEKIEKNEKKEIDKKEDKMDLEEEKDDKTRNNLTFDVKTTQFHALLTRDVLRVCISKQNIKISEKDYIFIPIHTPGHWILAVVINARNIKKKEKTEGKNPCRVFIFCSLGSKRYSNEEKFLEFWLLGRTAFENGEIIPQIPDSQLKKTPVEKYDEDIEMWGNEKDEKKKKERNEVIRTIETNFFQYLKSNYGDIEFHYPDCQSQKDGYNCGMFVCCFAEFILSNPIDESKIEEFSTKASPFLSIVKNNLFSRRFKFLNFFLELNDTLISSFPDLCYPK